MELEYTEQLDLEYDNLFEAWRVRDKRSVDGIMERIIQREYYTKKYAWAIPTVEALECIGKYGPLVEIGAGTGYWAYELRKRGVTIEAYDQYPPDGTEWTDEELEAYQQKDGKHPGKSWYHRGADSWTEVRQGTPEILKTYSREWNLFLCWPPYATDMAAYALGYHRGDFICYVGEDDGGCNGDHLFWKLLHKLYDQVEYENIPQWPGIHDYVAIYHRKGR